jgi:putative phosphoribosyl transferase
MLVHMARSLQRHDAMSDESSPDERSVEIPAGPVRLPAILGVPRVLHGVVVFAHGSGSGHLSPRNNAVARVLQEAGFATLLADLLTEHEAGNRRLVFDIELLANRLRHCAGWVRGQDTIRSLPTGYFGASTGAGAALVAAAQPGEDIGAVVSRGGRPDLAGRSLEMVRAPTLLIVGGNDEPVIELNEQALARLRCAREMVIVPGATHLFEEPGTLEEVARLAREWFRRYLQPRD